MDMETISTAIGSLGFPIFVAVWYMVQSSKDSKAMQQAINELKEAILTMQIKKEE